MNSKRLPACICALPVLVAMATGARADQGKPSRPPVDKCTWERLADRDVGLAA
ncbi:hypothetical protein NKH99_18335 [Mesorhizobium sp. M0854]